MTKESVTFDQFISKCLKRDYTEVENILSSGNFDVNREDFRGVTALHYAAELDDVELIKIILNQPKARINVKTLNMGSTPLVIAAGNGKLQALKYLLGKGADASITTNDGYTALMAAAESGTVECVEALLKDKKCSVNHQNCHGKNALMQGIQYPKVVELLINITDLTQEDEGQWNVLHSACFSGSKEIVRMLIEKNVLDLNKPNKDGVTPIYCAIKQKHFDLVEYLIEMGASLSEFTIHYTCGYDHIVISDDSETFYDRHDCPDELIRPIISLASSLNRTKTLKKFLKRYIEINPHFGDYEKGAVGDALEAASNSGNLECVKVLIESNLVHETSFITALCNSLRGNYFDCFEYLYKYISSLEYMKDGLESSKIEIAFVAFDSGCLEACKLLLNEGIDPNGHEPETFLMVASSNGHFEAVKLLIEHGADINTVHEEFGSALLLSTINNNYEVVKYLLENGADPTLCDELKYTPIMASCLYGYTKVFKELLAKDQNIEQQANEGITMFLAACTSGNLEIVKISVKSGANINHVDANNENCFHVASRKLEGLEVLIYLLGIFETDQLQKMLTAKNSDGWTPLDMMIKHSDQTYLFSILAVSKGAVNKYLTFPQSFPIEFNDNGDMCLICRDEFVQGDRAILLPCKHMFHDNCYTEWSMTKPNCPYCQRFPFKLEL